MIVEFLVHKKCRRSHNIYHLIIIHDQIALDITHDGNYVHHIYPPTQYTMQIDRIMAVPPLPLRRNGVPQLLLADEMLR